MLILGREGALGPSICAESLHSTPFFLLSLTSFAPPSCRPIPPSLLCRDAWPPPWPPSLLSLLSVDILHASSLVRSLVRLLCNLQDAWEPCWLSGAAAGGLPPAAAQLSCIIGNYSQLTRSSCPPPSSARCTAVGRFSPLLTSPRDGGVRPESEDGLGFSIGADPSDRRPIENPRPSPPARRRVRRSGGMANNRRRRSSEGASLRRSAPSVGRFAGRIRPQEVVPRFGEPPPPPLHRPRGPIGTRIEEERLGERRSPSRSPPLFVLVCSSSAFPPMSCLEIGVAGAGFSKPPPPPAPRPFASIGALSSPRSFPTAEGSPLRRLPSSVADFRRRHRRLPRSENRGRPVPRGSPSAPRPMGCRFGGPSLGEIVSPRTQRSSRAANRCGIGNPADAARWETGLLTPPPPSPKRPRTAMGAPISILGRSKRPRQPPSPPSPPSDWRDGRRSLLAPRFPSTGQMDPGNARVAPQWGGARSRVSHRSEGLASGPSDPLKLHSCEWS